MVMKVILGLLIKMGVYIPYHNVDTFTASGSCCLGGHSRVEEEGGGVQCVRAHRRSEDEVEETLLPKTNALWDGVKTRFDF